VNAFVLDRSEPLTLLSHMAFYGIAAILEDAGHQVRMSWTKGMAPRPALTGVTADMVGRVVHDHAAARIAEGAWARERIALAGTPRGLMSPRISTLVGEQWDELQRRRHAVLDVLTGAAANLDLRLLAALGEPSYWRTNAKGDRLQDDGAGRLEMQPRNQGSEFVANRLYPIGQAVAARTPEQIVNGLTGAQVEDEVGSNRSDSRSATGFAAPGPADNALVWCALWGISQLPICQRLTGPALTSCHVGRAGSGWFYVPVWRGSWLPARLQSMVASRALLDAASAGLPEAENAADSLAVAPARLWLAARSVTAVIRFPVRRFGSKKTSERRAQLGEILWTGVRP